MAGKSTQQSQSQTVSSPWGPTVGPLTNLTNTIASNANTLPSYENQAIGLANNLTGNQQNYNQTAADTLSAYQQQMSPFTQASYLDPMSNPYLGPALQTLQGDITNQIKDQFAAAGRSGSGLENQNLARGLSQGLAQLLLGQYNTNVDTYGNAAQNLYTAGNATNQGILGNTLTGIQVGQQVPLLANNAGATAGMLVPIAGLGGQTNSNSSGTMTQPWSQTWAQAMSPFKFTWGV